MTPKDLNKIPTIAQFMAVRDSLNLTDRQRAIFVLKLSKGWRNIDIAEELGISQDTVSEDVKAILPKLAVLNLDDFIDKKE